MKREWKGIRRHIFRTLLASFLVLAGINHFVMPEFYYPLIPDYLPFPAWINGIAGISEIGLGSLLLIAPLRRWAVGGIIAMLIAFVPAHIYFIQIGACVENGLCVPLWVAWVRLILIHPLLIAWAWYVRK
ncbi:MAG: hypothetical protein RMJ44_08595 [Cytophagales bacterium]|nr:hypothetical protein [Bernardetiaceae bacterium]MDW8211131.1 hypothetical protein [Cytophagales bacterium]